MEAVVLVFSSQQVVFFSWAKSMNIRRQNLELLFPIPIVFLRLRNGTLLSISIHTLPRLFFWWHIIWWLICQWNACTGSWNAPAIFYNPSVFPLLYNPWPEPLRCCGKNEQTSARHNLSPCSIMQSQTLVETLDKKKKDMSCARFVRWKSTISSTRIQCVSACEPVPQQPTPGLQWSWNRY